MDYIDSQKHKGRRILLILFTIMIIISIADVVLTIAAGEGNVAWTIFSAIVTIILWGFVYGGSKAAKWIIVIFSALRILGAFMLLTDTANLNVLVYVNLVATLIGAIPAFLLIKSSAINDFMDGQT
jgi:hypothetical protein